MNSQPQNHTLGQIEILKKRIDVMNAFLEGKPIQIQKRLSGVTTECDNPSWNWEDFEYFIKPTVLPTIDWTAITPEWKWFAFSADDTPILFTDKPEVCESLKFWRLTSSHSRVHPVPMLASVTRGNMPWYQTLIQRPDTVYGGI